MARTKKAEKALKALSKTSSSTGGHKPASSRLHAPLLERRGALVLVVAVSDHKLEALLSDPRCEGLSKVQQCHITLIAAAKLKGIDVGTMPVGRFPIPEGAALPKISFGNGALARRNKRKTYFVPVQDQYGLQCFVERLCHHFGLPGTPEKRRFFHMSLANNANGSPFQSIGDITK
eukprot:CAMPEP_0195512784 /NCGR_PEP_ID=MMETSP0794_2-20130614/4626_1 /TAXON_ID=515487 /ORGANISM="Stephanopyxis turris, Strain CCMP 815" /LENGTH=175 /DNA_ID=CAMNT_0040640649 /DNA_START=86 /DNA_END=610 /DNA_ORIENTATION=-